MLRIKIWNVLLEKGRAMYIYNASPHANPKAIRRTQFCCHVYDTVLSIEHTKKDIPSQRPDINPIENLWYCVTKPFQQHMVFSKAELKKVLKQE
uniref:Uncharacterized protein n=1 Tax=Glossina morsitans morsitans TaxID=37546 RepID=A0A1B0GE89_GLOMM